MKRLETVFLLFFQLAMIYRKCITFATSNKNKKYNLKNLNNMYNKMTASDKYDASFQFNKLEELMWYLDNYGKEYIKYWLKETGNCLMFRNKDVCYYIYKSDANNISMMDYNTKEIKWTYNVKKGNGYDYDKAMYLVYRNALEIFGNKEAA